MDHSLRRHVCCIYLFILLFLKELPDLEQPQGAPFKESPLRAALVRLREEETREDEACTLRAKGGGWRQSSKERARQVLRSCPLKERMKMSCCEANPEKQKPLDKEQK